MDPSGHPGIQEFNAAHFGPEEKVLFGKQKTALLSRRNFAGSGYYF